MDGLPPTARLVGIGFYVALCIALGAIGGREADKALDSDPALTLVGLGVGLVLAIYGGLRQLMDVMAEINQRRLGGKDG